jgi:hypothetical protein
MPKNFFVTGQHPIGDVLLGNPIHLQYGTDTKR